MIEDGPAKNFAVLDFLAKVLAIFGLDYFDEGLFGLGKLVGPDFDLLFEELEFFGFFFFDFLFGLLNFFFP